MTDLPSPAATEAPNRSLASLVGRLATLIDRALSPGDVATLRRLSFDDPGCAAFWRLVGAELEPQGALPAGGVARDHAERRWAAILGCLAMLRGLHGSATSFGVALARSDLSETRFLRLLHAHDDALLDEVRTIAHFLGQKGVHADLTDLAHLVLSDGRSDAERVRRRIARSFYAVHATS